MKQNKTPLRIAILAPHMFMQEKLMNDVIFSPGFLAIDLANGLTENGNFVTILTPDIVNVNPKVKNITGDFSLISEELVKRGYGLNELMAKHPLTYITFARQIQSELISKAYKMANDGEFDIVHVYMNEEDIAMNFAELCNVPVVFTHHEPLNYLTKYRTAFEKYKTLNWISISYSQRKTVISEMNWVGNVYHGIHKLKVNKDKISQPSQTSLQPSPKGEGAYFVYLGRIIEPKGVHLAIKAVKEFNKKNSVNYKLKIAGKHYSSEKDVYWETKVKPYIDNNEIIYSGFINNPNQKSEFLAGALALLVPSTWDEPFGMVNLEALAVGTPIIGLDNGALPEIIENNINGFLVKTVRKSGILNEVKTVMNLVTALEDIPKIRSENCLKSLEKFSIENMVNGHEEVYRNLISQKV